MVKCTYASQLVAEKGRLEYIPCFPGSRRRGRWASGLEEFKEYLVRSKSITILSYHEGEQAQENEL